MKQRHTLKIISLFIPLFLLLSAISLPKSNTLATTSDPTDTTIIMNTEHARITKNPKVSLDENKITVSNIDGGGLRLNFLSGCSISAIREGYTGNVNMNGLKLCFNNFNPNKSSDRGGQLAIIFGNAGDNGPINNDNTSPALVLVLDPYAGNIYAVPNDKGNTISRATIGGYEVIKSNLLKGTAVQNTPFSFAFASDGNGGFNLTVNISGQSLTGNIPSEIISMAKMIYKTGNTSIMIGMGWPYDNASTWGYSVDWLSIDPGTVDDKEGNFALTSENITLIQGATLDQGEVYLSDVGDGISFKAKTTSISAKMLSYVSVAGVDLYINDQKATDSFIFGYTNKTFARWHELASGLSAETETEFKIVKTENSDSTATNNPVIISGINLITEAEESLNAITIEDSAIKTLGLTSIQSETLPLYWSGTGAEFTVTGSDIVKARFNAPSAGTYINVYCNDIYTEKLEIDSGTSIVTLASNLDPNTVTTIRFVKAVEPQYGTATLLNLYCDGIVNRTADRKKILVIGDSITAGNEVLENYYNITSGSKGEDVTYAYGYIAGQMLNCDVDILAWSGSGLYATVNVSGNALTMPHIYQSVTCLNEKYELIIVNLGTNDSNADEETETNLVIDFKQMLSADYPQAKIIWAYGLLENARSQWFANAVALVESSDFAFIQLPQASKDDRANGGHPLIDSQNAAGVALYQGIRYLLVKDGDLNADFSTDSQDLVSLRLHLLETENSIEDDYADTNGDGLINICDLVHLKKLMSK